jgi:hypothetical protein
LVGNARELDVVSYGSFEQLDAKLLAKLGLKNLRKNDVDLTISKFQLADDNVAEMKFEVKSNLESDVDGLIVRAELYDQKNNPLEVRYISINDLFTQGSVVVPEMSTIHDANPKTKFIKCTPILYHEVDK